MATEVVVTDDEIESLMAELEAESEKIVGEAKPKKVIPEGPTPEEIQAEADRKELIAIKAAAKAKQEAKELAAVSAPKEESKDDAPCAAVSEETKPTPDARAVPDFVKKLQKAKPEPVEFEDVPDLDAIHAAKEAAAVPEVEAPPAKIAVQGLQHYIDVDQFGTDTRVTDATLDSCMIEQNGLRAYYGAQAARAEAQAARMKTRFEVIEATMYEEKRKTFAASGEKTTVQMVDSAVKMDARWLKAKNTVIEAESIAAINKSLVESLRDRASMIMQLSANRRDEFKGQARVMEERDERDELRDRALRAAQRAA